MAKKESDFIPTTTPDLKAVHLDDKYDLDKEQVFITGTQAVVRLTLMQKERDRRVGLDTGGYITG